MKLPKCPTRPQFLKGGHENLNKEIFPRVGYSVMPLTEGITEEWNNCINELFFKSETIF